MSLLSRPDVLAGFFPYVDQRYFTEDEGWDRPYGVCTYLNSSAVALIRKEGRKCSLWGADEPAMNTARKWNHHGGHDWLLVDDRFILDLWVPIYVNSQEDRRVWDLEAGGSFYLPERSLWEPVRLDDFESWFLEAEPDWLAHLKTFQTAE